MQKFHTLCEDIKIIFEKKLLIVEDNRSVGVSEICARSAIQAEGRYFRDSSIQQVELQSNSGLQRMLAYYLLMALVFRDTLISYSRLHFPIRKAG